MIKSDIYELKGKWVIKDNNVIEDEVCKQIKNLISNYFKKISNDTSGWNTLYLNESDGYYWELTYDSSQLQGGGPPTLTKLSKEDIKQKYPSMRMD